MYDNPMDENNYGAEYGSRSVSGYPDAETPAFDPRPETGAVRGQYEYRYRESEARPQSEPGPQPQSYQSAGAADKAQKKGSAIGRLFGVLFAGLLFGVAAAFAFVLILRLFPQQEETTVAGIGKKPPVEIEHTEPVVPDSHTEDEVNSEPEQEPSDQQEAKAGEDDAAASGDAQDVDEKQASDTSLAVVTDVTKVVDEVMPSVVSIFGTYEVTENYWGFEMQREEDGSGSGIIVGENEEELLIVTNNHVVADSTSLSVQFIDGEKYGAVVKGTDADSDLAVIAIQMTELKDATKGKIRIAALGDSDALRVGEPAIAIGNALGYGQSVTTGVISAVNRKYTQDENGKESYLIQTDAAINPGNSGGALLNIYGEVIGINSNKIGGYVVEGMGYAIPISTARPILENLMSKKTRVLVEDDQRGYLGISGINVTEDVQLTYGLPIGVYIAQVFDSTPAQKAGLQKGDVIISFDGEELKTMEELTKLLDTTAAGTQIELVIMRDIDGEYQEMSVRVTLAAQY
ncbi:MAG: trypsin-like peptidase domain-containing protein [Lachnospiraceae bacterium]|nr:trypsin-like peptidase domain-containing protein [Lachnospiraceae bacterium]